MDELEITNIIDSNKYDLFNSPPPPIYIGPVKVKSLKERLEEATMHEDCYFCIKRNICTKDVPKPCKYRYTEEERIADQASDNYGAIINGTYLHKTFRKKEEDKEMEPTSVWKIENIDNILITQDGDEMSLLLKNRDDLIKIILTGDAIKNHNDNFIMIMKVDLEENEKEFNKLEEEYEERIDEYEDKIDDLKRKYDLERAANDAHHKFFRQYAGKGTEIEFNYAIGDGDEVTYVIVDKKEYQSLMDKYEALRELKSPTVENFADKEPTSRRDILKAAEMCVCGQREQDYGTPESNFQLIADLWNDYLKKERSSIVVDAKDVAMMMALMKIARIRNGGGSGDSFVDLAGYAACGGEIWYGGKKSISERE